MLVLQHPFFFPQIFHQGAFVQFEQPFLSIEVFFASSVHRGEVFDNCISSATLISLFASIFALLNLQATFPLLSLFLHHGFP